MSDFYCRHEPRCPHEVHHDRLVRQRLAGDEPRIGLFGYLLIIGISVAFGYILHSVMQRLLPAG